jgi:hypothetical protein
MRATHRLMVSETGAVSTRPPDNETVNADVDFTEVLAGFGARVRHCWPPAPLAVRAPVLNCELTRCFVVPARRRSWRTLDWEACRRPSP